MIKGIGKFLLGTLFVFFVVVVAGLLVIRFSPQTLLALASQFSPYVVKSAHIETELFPLAVNTKDTIVYLDEDENKPDQALFIARAIKLKADYAGYLQGNANVLLSSVKDAFLDVSKFTSGTQTENLNSDDANSSPIELHPWLALLTAEIDDFTIKVDDSSIVEVSLLDSEFDSNVSGGERSYSIDAFYKDVAGELKLGANLSSFKQDGVNVLLLEAKEIDLTNMLVSAESEPQTPRQDDDMEVSEPVDLSWLDAIARLRLKLNLGQLKIGDDTLSNVELSTLLDGKVDVEYAKFDADWALGTDWHLRDSFSIKGELEPDRHSTANLSLSGQSKTSTFSINGNADLKDFLKSNLAIKLSSSTLPIIGSDNGDQAESLAQWFPANVDANLSPSKNQSADGVVLNLNSLTVGESDLRGRVEIKNLEAASQNVPVAINAKLSSNQIKFSSGEQENDPVESASESANESSKLFSDTPIDWAWLSDYEIESKLTVAKLQFDTSVLENLSLPIMLNKRGLQIDSFETELGGGSMSGQVGIEPSEQGAKLALGLNASGMDLSRLQLVDESLLRGGDTVLTIALDSDGTSPHELASNLAGQINFQMNDATIGNDAFELLGSDLVMSLLSKLNPFLKSDPTTELKCAVVNLNVKDGVIDVDKSIAMETTKMVIVADGDIDLGKETLDLGVTPKTQQGVGLDVSTLVKGIKLGGTLTNPRPAIGAGGILKSGASLTAAISTGGASLVLDGLVSKMTSGKACERALSAK